MGKFSKNSRICWILMKFEINVQIFEKSSNMSDFNEILN